MCMCVYIVSTCMFQNLHITVAVVIFQLREHKRLHNTSKPAKLKVYNFLTEVDGCVQKEG